MSSSTACPSLPSAALGDSVTDLRVRTNWKRGPAADCDGPFLVSYTEFTPKTLRDMPRIHRAAERLRAEIAELEGAIGVTTYWQLFRGRVGSLSAWEDEAALRRFVALPFQQYVETPCCLCCYWFRLRIVGNGRQRQPASQHGRAHRDFY